MRCEQKNTGRAGPVTHSTQATRERGTTSAVRGDRGVEPAGDDASRNAGKGAEPLADDQLIALAVVSDSLDGPPSAEDCGCGWCAERSRSGSWAAEAAAATVT